MDRAEEFELDAILRRRFTDDALSWEAELKQFIDDLLYEREWPEE